VSRRRTKTEIVISQRMSDDELIEMLGPKVIWRLFKTLNWEANIADLYVNGSEYDRRITREELSKLTEASRQRVQENIACLSEDDDE
jgi:hypothetical protein